MHRDKDLRDINDAKTQVSVHVFWGRELEPCKAVALSHTSHVLIGNTVTSFLSLYLTFVPRPLLVVPNRARSCSVLRDLSVFPVLAEQVHSFSHGSIYIFVN